MGTRFLRQALRSPRPWIALALLLFAMSAGLWHKGFWGAHGESRRAECAREIVVSGNWLVPELLGEPFITKPPLLYWSIAGSFSVFGVGELQARLPGLAAVLASCWLLFGIRRRESLLEGAKEEEALEKAHWTALGAASLPLLAGMGQNAETEPLLFFFTVLSIAGWSRLAVSRPLGLLGIVIGLSGGFLVKGPLAWLFGGGALLAAELCAGRQRRLKALDWLLLLVAHLALVLPWFLLVLQEVPGARETWMGESVARIGNADFEVHRQPFWYYLPRLFSWSPWILVLPLAIRQLVAEAGDGRQALQRAWPLVWLVMGLLVLSLATSKRAHYMLCLLPGLLLLLPAWGGRATPWETYTRILLRGLAWLVALLLPIALAWTLWQSAHHPMQQALGLAIALVLPALLLASRKDGKQSLLAASVVFPLAMGATGLGLFPALDEYRSPRAFYADVRETIGVDTRVLNWMNDRYSASFYLERHVHPVRQVDEIRTRLPEGGWLISEAKHAAGLEGIAREVLRREQIDPFRPDRRRGWVLLQLEPLP